ncbi:ABC transporter substrate-binding protein [Paenibacillus alba]|nr:ABC transporter substrate-binding protein [Paenibacillus alba]
MMSSTIWNRAQALSLEKLPDLDADYIFVLVQGKESKTLMAEYENSTLWKNLPAVKNGHVFEMPSNYWMASGAIAKTKKIDDVLSAIIK